MRIPTGTTKLILDGSIVKMPNGSLELILVGQDGLLMDLSLPN